MTDARRDKILRVAIELAEEGGFDNVRQREVASRAGIALGTLYKSFRSKQDLLAAALAQQVGVVERRMERRPARGDTPEERLISLFGILTRHMTRKRQFARAVLRAVASGEPTVAANVTAYYARIAGLIIAAVRGVGRLGSAEATTAQPSRHELTLAWVLQNIWFAALVGWSAGLQGQAEVIAQMETATQLVMRAALD